MPDTGNHLKVYLASRTQAPFPWTYHALQGFVFAMASGPFAIPVPQWAMLLLPQMDDATHDEFCDLYRDIERGIVDGTPTLPADCPIDPDPLKNLDPDAPLREWSRGFRAAQMLFEPIWKDFLRELMKADAETSMRFVSSVVRLNLFASRDILDVMTKESPRPLAEVVAEACETFESDMAVYAIYTRPSRERAAGSGPDRRPEKSPGTSGEKVHLKEFLARPANPPGVMSYHEIQGLIFAVSSAPRPVELLEWVPLALGPAPPAALEERQPIIEDLMALYREIEARDKRGLRDLPPDCPLAPDPMANLDPASPVCQWSRGFFAGHNLVAGSWASALKVLVQEDVRTATELSQSTLRLLFFSSREMADTIWNDGKTASIEEAAAEVHRNFQPSMVFYAERGKGFREQLVRRRSEPVAGVQPWPSPRRATARPGVGRNEPCPCGSGKKYKKCCGGVMH